LVFLESGKWLSFIYLPIQKKFTNLGWGGKVYLLVSDFSELAFLTFWGIPDLGILD